MATIIKNGKRQPRFKEGKYKFTIFKVEHKTNMETRYGKQDRFYMHLRSEDNRILSQMYHPWIFQDSRLGKHLTQLLGSLPEDGFDADVLVGIQCIVTIEHVTDHFGNVFDNIKEIVRQDASESEQA